MSSSHVLWERDEDWKLLDSNHQGIFSGEWSQYAWGNITNLTGDELFNTLREAIERFEQLPGLTDTGRLLFRQSTLKILDRPPLRAVVQGIHQMVITSQGTKDPKGDMYEYLLSKILSERLNVRQTETIVQEMDGSTAKSKRGSERSMEEIDLEDRLRNSFGTKIKLHRNRNGSGLSLIHI